MKKLCKKIVDIFKVLYYNLGINLLWLKTIADTTSGMLGIYHYLVYILGKGAYVVDDDK